MIDGKILIVGGGIGGLAAALSLARQGFEVSVFEQAPELTDIGAGIQLGPNCNRVLFDLDLEDALRAVVFLPDGGEMRDWQSGKVIMNTTLGDHIVHEYGYPYFHIHRADLISLLAAAVAETNNIELFTDAAVATIDQTSAGVTLDTVSGNHVTGAVLIGADGIRSVVREYLFGPADPRFTGNVAWRALVPVDRLPSGLVRPMATAWWGPGGHFVHYYVSRGQLVNCVCVIEKEGWEIESWSEPGDYEELKSDFSGWHENIQLLIDHADKDSLFKWALFDRAPMRQWGRGLITLLGDACHPTLPFMAQGAAMAIEDGAVLSRCLTMDGSIEIRLRSYEHLRQARTARVQKGSRRNATVYHLRGIKALLRNIVAKRASVSAMKWLFSYNALTAHQ